MLNSLPFPYWYMKGKGSLREADAPLYRNDRITHGNNIPTEKAAVRQNSTQSSRDDNLKRGANVTNINRSK